ncbi:GNAT family N-acetyltransferase [Sulfuricurvum sp.]|uniref:GNAT family N-acetyltransferase n=1 Tax=Sulfuricurvum sp. TaxID=2025608 RepID=UPI002637D4B9|nr:GNAT family N-acetyltransferase [Sulfuricurvum sp.]MDD3597877.1 GNAT family N-acetyltransferase [Sulfuricurvum sp.]
MSKSLVFNKVPLEEIEVGMSVSYSQTITDSDIKAFAGISGDRNPVHLDEDYAQKSRFKKRIAHGMMTASYFSALFGTKIPGEGCVYTHQSLNFKKPVYIDDTVVATVTVTNVDIEKRRVKFNTVCKVQDVVVTDGEAELHVPLEFNKIIIDNKEELLKYKTQIFKLFKDSFNDTIDDELWKWAYIDNPNGNPIVSLYFDGSKLVGHYAVVPINLIYQQKSIKALLSMTTMVDASYRKYGIFVEQANEVYEKACTSGYKLVCGFPNKKSAPGFKKRLGWTLKEDLYVAKFSYDELQSIEKKTYPNAISFNTQDQENIEWRLNKPNKEYIRKNNNILKKFDGNFDIVFNGSDFSMLDKNYEYNLLLDHELDKYEDKKQFDYIFGYKLFDSTLAGIEFKKDLLMSDVF